MSEALGNEASANLTPAGGVIRNSDGSTSLSKIIAIGSLSLGALQLIVGVIMAVTANPLGALLIKTGLATAGLAVYRPLENLTVAVRDKNTGTPLTAAVGEYKFDPGMIADVLKMLPSLAAPQPPTPNPQTPPGGAA